MKQSATLSALNEYTLNKRKTETFAQVFYMRVEGQGHPIGMRQRTVILWKAMPTSSAEFINQLRSNILTEPRTSRVFHLQNMTKLSLDECHIREQTFVLEDSGKKGMNSARMASSKLSERLLLKSIL